jgi:hypothetical protein
MIVWYSTNSYTFHATCHSDNGTHKVLNDEQFLHVAESRKLNNKLVKALAKAEEQYETAKQNLLQARLAVAAAATH